MPVRRKLASFAGLNGANRLMVLEALLILGLARSLADRAGRCGGGRQGHKSMSHIARFG